MSLQSVVLHCSWFHPPGKTLDFCHPPWSLPESTLENMPLCMLRSFLSHFLPVNCCWLKGLFISQSHPLLVLAGSLFANTALSKDGFSMYLISVNSVWQNHTHNSFGNMPLILYYEELPPIRLLRDPTLKLPRNPFVQLREPSRHHLLSDVLVKEVIAMPLITFSPKLNLRLLVAGNEEFYFPNKQVLCCLNPSKFFLQVGRVFFWIYLL